MERLTKSAAGRNITPAEEMDRVIAIVRKAIEAANAPAVTKIKLAGGKAS